ncbi:MAG: DUF2062 domain-containing protein [Rhodospirillales bacterium]|nr:DUF2062 domain-containing protein [Rhodospirillales bacterium]
MFRRNQKLSFPERARDFLWPRSGWRRSSQYIFHRVARIPGTPYSLAAGFACGAAVSFTPFIGLHFLMAAALAFVIRANILASAIGTAVGNPWTFPFIWIWIYELGHGLIGTDAVGGEKQDFISLFSSIIESFLRLDLSFFIDKAFPVWFPMLIGSLPTALVVWIIFYIPLRPLIDKYQNRRRRRRRRAMAAANESFIQNNGNHGKMESEL